VGWSEVQALQKVTQCFVCLMLAFTVDRRTYSAYVLFHFDFFHTVLILL